MADTTDWARIAIEVGIAALSGLSGSWLTAYRMGRAGAKKEQAVEKSIDAIKSELGAKLNEAEKNIEDKIEENTQHFSETFKALREKINSVELDTEKRFLKKQEFTEFHKEYREDQRRLGDKLDTLLNRQASIMQDIK